MDIKDKLRAWAAQYNIPQYIDNDPIQFPHRYTEKKDIEVSAFFTAWAAMGNSQQIIAVARKIDGMFNGHPYQFIMNDGWEKYRHLCYDDDVFYRNLRWFDFYTLCSAFQKMYTDFQDMESMVAASTQKTLVNAVCNYFLPYAIRGLPNPYKGSACSRICLFLRWMVRNDGIVDFGIWKRTRPCDLMVPLNNCTYNAARELGILSDKAKKHDITTAHSLTLYMGGYVFPGDPALGYFALCGVGTDKQPIDNEENNNPLQQ